jgi:hypothetical protein
LPWFAVVFQSSCQSPLWKGVRSDTLPPSDVIHYAWTEEQLPAQQPTADLNMSLPKILHIACFGWGPAHSVKGAPELVTALKLVAEILTVILPSL